MFFNLLVSLTDIADYRRRTGNFALLGIAFGLRFILGSFIVFLGKLGLRGPFILLFIFACFLLLESFSVWNRCTF
ncbi:hypothetical protein HNQ69_000305 [Bartonella callosciuri]|uniref:Uncharacterized protein n=1 Tax=Bartonella callosciuri TaxID=686223 RepID=A0A840NQ40_9HYPH|nr:hypothetical protein [Bartonella callosciuri]